MDYVLPIIYLGAGMAIGISIGISIGKQEKPWSELTEKEKRTKKLLIGAGFFTLVVGILVNLWFFFR